MNEKLSLLTSVLGDFYKAGNEYIFNCPYCNHHKKKLSINLDKGFHCWICDARGKSPISIIKKFGTKCEQKRWKELSGFVENLSDFERQMTFEDHESEEQREEILKIPEGFRTLTGKQANKASHKALRYLTERGLNKYDILYWKIGYCSSGAFENRIIVPSFNESGDLNYYIARTFSDDYWRYKNPKVSRNIIFNELYLDFDEEIMIVEGVFDAIKSKNAVPILGSTIRETSKLFKKIIEYKTPVLLALDPDANRKSASIKKLLLKYGVKVREVEYKSGETRDIGDMTKEEVEKMSKSALNINENDDILSAIADI